MIHDYAGHMRMLQKSLVLFHSKQFVFSLAEKSSRTKAASTKFRSYGIKFIEFINSLTNTFTRNV